MKLIALLPFSPGNLLVTVKCPDGVVSTWVVPASLTLASLLAGQPGSYCLPLPT